MPLDSRHAGESREEASQDLEERGLLADEKLMMGEASLVF